MSLSNVIKFETSNFSILLILAWNSTAMSGGDGPIGCDQG